MNMNMKPIYYLSSNFFSFEVTTTNKLEEGVASPEGQMRDNIPCVATI